jgi:hypothetical protein
MELLIIGGIIFFGLLALGIVFGFLMVLGLAIDSYKVQQKAELENKIYWEQFED